MLISNVQAGENGNPPQAGLKYGNIERLKGGKIEKLIMHLFIF
jgi:hypothetical protein